MIKPTFEAGSFVPSPRDPLLQEREKTHGDYRLHAGITQQIKIIIHTQLKYEGLSNQHKESLDMIAHKIGRILAGNPRHKDHWDDIAGYAKLGAEACDGN